MTRVTNIEQQNQMLQYLQQLQAQGQSLETQIASGKKSQTYAGISKPYCCNTLFGNSKRTVLSGSTTWQNLS